MEDKNLFIDNDSKASDEKIITNDFVQTDILDKQTDLNIEKILGEGIGTQLANTMAENGFHPVLIFGAPASGKTTFLLSLIRYMFVGLGSDSQIRLCLEPFPNESNSMKKEHKELDKDRWLNFKKYANELFNKSATDFFQGNQLPSATFALSPFFVPIEITPKNTNLKPLKIAFLEGRGEWYKVISSDNGNSPHQSFKQEIHSFLERFPSSITSIFVAPYAIDGYESMADGESNSSSSKIKERDFALYGLIDQLESKRKNQIGSDNYLYLLTKWDIRCNSVSHPEFIYKDPKIVKNEILVKFPASFSRFQNISEKHPEESKNKKNHSYNYNNKKTVSAYCAGILKYAVISLPEESSKLVDHYSRKIWNYLYLNATNEYLYLEFKPKKIGFFDKISNWIKN